MSTENIVNVQISEEDKTTIEGAIATLEEKLMPYLIALTPDQRRNYPKVKDKTLPFVEKVSDYVDSSSEFVPGFMKVDEFKTDFAAYSMLIGMLRRLNQINTSLDDTILMSGSESYKAALGYYNSVKQAAKMNVPNAKDLTLISCHFST